MKRIYALPLVLLMLTACGTSATDSESNRNISMTSELVVSISDENFYEPYGDCIKRYFEAIEAGDFSGYTETVYAPYQTAYAEFLQSKGDATLESNFKSLQQQFDEDGYADWHFTNLELSYHANEDIDAFFDDYVEFGVFDEAFVTACKEDAIEIRDVQFTLYALYTGDTEATPVVRDSEMIVIRTDEGCYLFG